MLGLSQAHSDALQNEWQSFLNLCICQEVHLDNIDNYRKVRHLLTLGNDVFLWLVVMAQRNIAPMCVPTYSTSWM